MNNKSKPVKDMLTISNDFKFESGELKQWLKDNFADKIIDLAYEKAVVSRDKDAITRYKKRSEKVDDENNYLGCLALSAIFYMCPSKNKSSGQSLEKMFLKVPRGTMINQEIQKISEKVKGKQKEMNPFIIYYENENGIAFKFFVCINHLIYEMTNFISALDILFKSYFVFFLKYPPECVNVLTFLQHFFYKIFLDSDIASTTILGLMCDIDIERGRECQQLWEQKPAPK